MCGEQGLIAVHKTVHLVKFVGKGCSIFFSNSYVTLLSTTGYKVLKYSSRIRIAYNFRFLLFTLGILSRACQKHIQTRFSLKQFRFWSITHSIMLCHVSAHRSALCLRHRARDPISVAYFNRVALFSDFKQVFELLDQVLLPIAVMPFIYILELSS